MIPYLLVFTAFLSTYFVLETTIHHRTLSRVQRCALLLPLGIFTVLYAGRIGSDVESYGRLFEFAEEFPQELGFSLLMIGAKLLGLDYVGFTKFLAVVQMLLLLLIVMRLRDPLFFLLFYMSTFYLNFQFNAIRNSLALLIFGAIYVRTRPSLLTLIFSSFVHYSSVLTLLFHRLSLLRPQGWVIIMVTLAAFILSLIWLKPDLFGPVNDLFIYKGHMEGDRETKIIYPALLLKLFVVWLMYRNGLNRFYMAVFTILVILVHAVSPILSRLSDIVLFLALLDFCYHHRLVRMRFLAIGLACVLVLSSLKIPLEDCLSSIDHNWCLSGSIAG